VPLDLWEETKTLLQELETAGLDYAIVGALALAVHGAPRATTDIDLLIPPHQLDEVLGQARSCGFRVEALPMRFSDGMELRRTTKIDEDGDVVTLDLLLVDANLEPIWDSRLRIETGFGSVWVVSRDALIRMKALAGREQDLGDIRRLEDLDR